MNCINCYKEIPEDTNFCPYCGAQQAAPASAPEAPAQPAAAPIPDAPVQSDSAAPTPEAPAQPEAAAPAPEAPVQSEAAAPASEASAQPEAAAPTSAPEAPVQPEAAAPTPEAPVQPEAAPAQEVPVQQEYSQPIYNQPEVNYGQQIDYGQGQTQYSQEPAVNWVPYLVFSILCTILCCLPFGVVAIVFAAKINSALAAGNIAEAKDCAKKSKIWIIVSAAVGLLVYILAIVFVVVIGVGTATYYY